MEEAAFEVALGAEAAVFGAVGHPAVGKGEDDGQAFAGADGPEADGAVF